MDGQTDVGMTLIIENLRFKKIEYIEIQIWI